MGTLIVALGGGDARKQKAIELSNATPDSRILFTGEPDLMAMYTKWHVKNGVFTRYISNNTQQDMIQIWQANLDLGFQGYNSILIITSNYHVPRAKVWASRFLKGLPYLFIGVDAPCDWACELQENWLRLKAELKLP